LSAIEFGGETLLKPFTHAGSLSSSWHDAPDPRTLALPLDNLPRSS
jgi:hypothetical protein